MGWVTNVSNKVSSLLNNLPLLLYRIISPSMKWMTFQQALPGKQQSFGNTIFLNCQNRIFRTCRDKTTTRHFIWRNALSIKKNHPDNNLFHRFDLLFSIIPWLRRTISKKALTIVSQFAFTIALRATTIQSTPAGTLS